MLLFSFEHSEMKQTLLEMVQDILSDMDSDEVNSIGDTVEALQTAQVIKSSYYEMLANRNWPHTRKLAQLDNVTDLDRPNYLKLPEALKEMEVVRYDVQKLTDSRIIWREVKYKHPDEFIDYIGQRNSSNSNVITVEDFGGSNLLIFNDQAPQFWTSFDDTYIVTDSYDSEIDDTLQGSKTQCLAYFVPTWETEDDFIPDLPIDAFPALIEQAKSTAFVVVKQMPNPKAEQKADRQQRWLSRKAWRAAGGVRYPNYGRK